MLETGELAEAAAIAGLGAEAAARAADVLVAAGFVRGGRPLRFVHPVVRRGIYDDLGAGERAQMHRRAAAVLADAGAARERVAEHLLATHPAGDACAAAQLRTAAATAVGRGAPVEGHLTSAFRKLDLSSRSELGTALNGAPTGAAR